MNTLHALILGVVEGITEFLPISSTGHLILFSEAIGLPKTEFLKTFEISIQLGAICAPAVLYWRKLITNLEIIKRVFVAFLSTGFLGFVLYKHVKSLLGNSDLVAWSLLIGGVVFIVFELIYREEYARTTSLESMSYKQCLLIGTIQSISMIPGVSRAAATIFGGLTVGLDRKTIVEFSFLLAIPTMAAATGYDLLKSSPSLTMDELLALAVGFITSFVVAVFVVRGFLRFIQKHNFIPFGIYRIVVSVLYFVIL